MAFLKNEVKHVNVAVNPWVLSPFSQRFYLYRMNVNIRKSENFHILLWLLKDLCWVMNFKVMGLIMIAPTVAVAVYIAALTRKSSVEFLHNLAVVCWICANSIWMVGEFFYKDGTRPIAAVFFITGLLLVGYHYGSVLLNNWLGKPSPGSDE